MIYRADIKKPAGPLPDIEDFVRKLASKLITILDPSRDARMARLQEVIKFREYLGERSRADLARTLEVVGNRALDYAKKLSGASHDFDYQDQYGIMSVAIREEMKL